jgi:hypothetical protein
VAGRHGDRRCSERVLHDEGKLRDVPQHQRKEWKLTTYGLTEGEGSAALRHSARRLRLSYGGAAGSVSSSGIRGCSSTYRRGRREAGESGRRRPQMGENRGGGGAAYRRRKRVGEGTKCCPGKALSRRAARGLVGTVVRSGRWVRGAVGRRRGGQWARERSGGRAATGGLERAAWEAKPVRADFVRVLHVRAEEAGCCGGNSKPGHGSGTRDERAPRTGPTVPKGVRAR